MSRATIPLPRHALAAQVQGRGRPVLLLHGAGGPGQFGPVVEALAATRRVIAPVHPGFDGTECPPELSTVEDLAFLYLDLLDQLDDGPVDVIGFSLGGWIALELALLGGAQVRSLTVVGAPGIAAPGAPVGDIFGWPPEERLRRLVFDPALAARLSDVPVDEAEVERRRQNWQRTTVLAQAAGWRSTRLETWLHRLRMPVHVVWGAEDALFPVALAHAYATRLPHAALTVLGQCGHLAHLERPAELLRSLGGFLRRLDEPSWHGPTETEKGT